MSERFSRRKKILQKQSSVHATCAAKVSADSDVIYFGEKFVFCMTNVHYTTFAFYIQLNVYNIHFVGMSQRSRYVHKLCPM